MNEERSLNSRSGSSRLLVTFMLGVCVGLSLYHAWSTSREDGITRLASVEEPGAPPPETPPHPAPEETLETAGVDAQPRAPEPLEEEAEEELSPEPVAGEETPVPPAEETPVEEMPREEVVPDEPVPEDHKEPAPEEPELEPAAEPATEPSLKELKDLWPARHLFVGLPGPKLDEETRAWLAEFKPGGVVLRHENLYSALQTRELIAAVREAIGLGDRRTDLPLFALVQEGGPQANALGLEDAPSAAALGRMAAAELAVVLAKEEPDPRAIAAAVAPIRDTAIRYARAAKERGIAVVLAPVLDVFRPGASDPRLRDRTFSTDAVRVSVCGQAFADGLLAGGVIPVVKHYPGLGAAKALADGTLVIGEEDAQTLASDIFMPFALAADRQVAGMLVAPIAVPVLDRSGRPASLSPNITGKVLRDKWNYEGVVIADNIDALPADEAFVGALAAGCDAMVLYDANWETLRACAMALAQALAAGEITEAALAERRGRLEGWQTRLGGTPGRIPEEAPAEEETVTEPETVAGEATVETEEEQPAEADTFEAETPPEPIMEDEAAEETTVVHDTAAVTVEETPPAGEVAGEEPVTAVENAEEETGESSTAEPPARDEQEQEQPVTLEDAAVEGTAEAAGDAPPAEAEAEPPVDKGDETPVAEEEKEAPPEEKAPEEEASPAPEPAAQPEGTRRREHVIRRGDTLNAIARLYKVTVSGLMAWNGLTDGNIKFGFKLLVYVPEERFEQALEAGPDAFLYYTIQPGDKLSEVAARFGITEDALIQLNGLTNPDKIISGQRIKVPKTPEDEADEEPEPEEDGPEEEAGEKPADAP